MKNLELIDCVHVTSEPGDATRYDYIFYKDYDEYVFMPLDNHFNYPQRINKWEVEGINEINETVTKIAVKYNCNPYTVLECIRTVNEIEANTYETIL